MIIVLTVQSLLANKYHIVLLRTHPNRSGPNGGSTASYSDIFVIYFLQWEHDRKPRMNAEPDNNSSSNPPLTFPFIIVHIRLAVSPCSYMDLLRFVCRMFALLLIHPLGEYSVVLGWRQFLHALQRGTRCSLSQLRRQPTSVGCNSKSLVFPEKGRATREADKTKHGIVQRRVLIL